MKNLLSSIAPLLAGAACALALGGCSRAEYAMLPQGPAYHGSVHRAAPASAAPETTVAAQVADVPAVASAEAPEIALATPVEASAQAVPTAPVASAPAPAAATVTPAATPAAVAAAPAQLTPAVKLNAFQRLAVAKVTRQLHKAVQDAPSFSKKQNTAEAQKVGGKLRQGLILLLVGLLIGIVGGAVGGTIGNIIGLVGIIFAVLGAVLIILYLLDEL